MLFRRPVGYEEVGEEPAERRVVAPPPDANEVDKRLGFQPLRLRLRSNPSTLRVGVQQHQMRDPLGMPQCIGDTECAALRKAEEDEERRLDRGRHAVRSAEHTYELQSLMRT